MTGIPMPGPVRRERPAAVSRDAPSAPALSYLANLYLRVAKFQDPAAPMGISSALIAPIALVP